MPANRYIMTTQSQDRTGIVAALTTALADHAGFIHELAQFGTPSSERFYSRIDFSMEDAVIAGFREQLLRVCDRFGLDTKIIPHTQTMPTAIMVSKFDHCLNDLLYRYAKGDLAINISVIISNHKEVKALADRADVPFIYIPVTQANKPHAEAQLRDVLSAHNIELIILARYMQILSNGLCADYFGRIINIHHSFLPSFKGARPYHRAYARGVKLIGATAHYVTPDLDEGPIIEQMVERVDHTQTPEALIKIGRDVEARTLAKAVQLHSEHRAFINGEKTVILP